MNTDTVINIYVIVYGNLAWVGPARWIKQARATLDVGSMPNAFCFGDVTGMFRGTEAEAEAIRERFALRPGTLGRAGLDDTYAGGFPFIDSHDAAFAEWHRRETILWNGDDQTALGVKPLDRMTRKIRKAQEQAVPAKVTTLAERLAKRRA